MKIVGRLLWIAIVVAGLGGLAWLAFRPLPQDVDVGVVVRGGFEVMVDNDGRTRVKDRYVIRAPLDGTLHRVVLEPGDAVVAGSTPLFTVEPLEPSLLDERAVATAGARVHAAEAASELAERQHENAGDQLKLARSAYARLSQLLESRIVSEDEVERAERDVRLWEGELRAARAQMEVARFEQEVAEAALLRTRPANGLEPEERRLAVVAPIDGRVFRVQRESAGPIAAGEPVLEIGDPAELEVVADYLSTDAVRIEPGMPALLEAWGGATPLHARVRLVEPSGFTKISALGVEEQRVDVVLDLVEPPERRTSLGDGFRVEVRVVVVQRAEVLQVSEGSLFRDGDGWAVFRIVDDMARRTRVEVGARNGLWAEIEGGLEEGDRVVLHPTDAIDDGVAIVSR